MAVEVISQPPWVPTFVGNAGKRNAGGSVRAQIAIVIPESAERLSGTQTA